MELLYIAQCFKIPIAEVAVNWTEIEGRLIDYIDFYLLHVIFCWFCIYFIYVFLI